jgi:uroporphyrinogen III methyltransferase/synthase
MNRMAPPDRGVVYLVGAGPGDAGLITVRGRQLLRRAEVVIHDRLIGFELLAGARRTAEIIDVGKVPGHHKHRQGEINALLIDRARRGRVVVRLKGGDPFVFGRGWEEWRACRDAGIPCIPVPGVTSAIAAPAAAGIPIIHRGAGSSFAVVTAHPSSGRASAALDYQALAKIDTVVIMMGRSNLAEVTRALIAAGRDPTTPAACVERGAAPQQRLVVADLATIAEAADRESLQAPAVTVVGQVARCAEEYREYLDSLCQPWIDRHEPLTGKRIVITRSSSTSSRLRRRLTAQGAIVIECPLIETRCPTETPALDKAIPALSGYDWIAFTSVHTVHGFFERLFALGQDARALAGCQVAAVGPITAKALRNRGVNPELVPRPHSAATLAKDILERPPGRPGRVLCLGGDPPCSALVEPLRQAGIVVDECQTHLIEALMPPEAVLRTIRQGCDAILFCSPRAARRFVELRLKIANAAIACLGPSTAAAARQAGLAVVVVAKEHTDTSLVAALGTYLADRSVPSRVTVP